MKSKLVAAAVGATHWRRGRTGAVGTGLRERAEWAEPGSVTDSYYRAVWR